MTTRAPLPGTAVRLDPWPRAVGASEELIRSICTHARAIVNDLPTARAAALAGDLFAALLEGTDQAWTEWSGDGNSLLRQPQRAFLLIEQVTRGKGRQPVRGWRLTWWKAIADEPDAGALLWSRLVDLPAVLLRMLSVAPDAEAAEIVVHGLLGVACVLLDAPGDHAGLLPEDLVEIGGDAMCNLYPDG